jgi:hypothetical protein
MSVDSGAGAYAQSAGGGTGCAFDIVGSICASVMSS